MKNQEVSFIKNQKKSHEEFSIKMRMMNVISVKDNRHGTLTDEEIKRKYDLMPDLKPETIRKTENENYLTYGDVFTAIGYMMLAFFGLLTPVLLLLWMGINK